MTGNEPFYVQHGAYEIERRKASPGQSPQYDIAFVLNENPRVMWPLEAKTLKTDGAVADYVDDVQTQLLTCRYAPFSSEGGILGYLLSGEPVEVFDNIEAKLPCVLHHHPAFHDRDHKVSKHRRIVEEGKSYPQGFRCHHLIFSIQAREAEQKQKS